MNADFFSIPSDNEASNSKSGCRELLLAILEDLFVVRRLTSTQTYAAKGLKAQRRNDEMWIRSDDDGVMSFLWVCSHLQLDPQKIRRIYFSHGEQEEKIAA